MSQNRLRSAANQVGSGLKSFIKMSDPSPATVAALLTGTAILFAIAYAVGHWL